MSAYNPNKKYFNPDTAYLIPKPLADLKQWLVWKLITKKGKEKPDKIPFWINGELRQGKQGGDNDRNNLSTLSKAVEIVESDGYAGLGFAVLPDDGIVALDFDDCIDSQGDIDKRVFELIGDTYAERSPSGRGIRAFYIAENMPTKSGVKDGLKVEIKGNSSFVTITCDVINFNNVDIKPLPDAIKKRLLEIVGNVDSAGAKEISNLPGWQNKAIKGVEQGQRNETLFKLVCRWENQGLSIEEITMLSKTINENFTPPLRQDELLKIIRSGYKYRQKKDTAGDGIDSKFIIGCLDSNEDGDARLYNRLNSKRFIYDHTAAEWFEWQNHYWKLDVINNSMAAIEEVIGQYDQESKRQFDQSRAATKAGDKEKSRDHAAVAGRLNARILKLQTAQRKRNVLFLASAGNGLTGAEWDKAAGLLPCANGIVDLRTGELRPGAQEDFIKTVAPTAWEGIDAPCPAWEKFVEDIFDGDTDLISYAQRVIGYSLLGNPVEHIMVILFGEGRNGKGTFLETIQAVLGPDGLAYKTESSLLLKDYIPKNSGAPNTGVLSLRGKRIVFASETNEEARLDSSKIKEFTGGDTLNARGIRAKHHVTFPPSHVLYLMTNTKPTAPGNDFALWQRIHLVPFKVKFIKNPTEKNQRAIDMHLPKKLLDESSGILAWMVRGALEYSKTGLVPPEVVLQATSKYQSEQDVIGLFISERCITGEGLQVAKGILYKGYASFCDAEGFKPLSGISFWRQIDIRGFDSYKDGATRKKYFLGIGLSENRTS